MMMPPPAPESGAQDREGFVAALTPSVSRNIAFQLCPVAGDVFEIPDWYNQVTPIGVGGFGIVVYVKDSDSK